MDSQAKYNNRDISSKRYQDGAHNSTVTRTQLSHKRCSHEHTHSSNHFQAHVCLRIFIFIFVLYTIPSLTYY